MVFWKKIALILGLIAVLVTGFSRLRLETDVFALLPATLPEVQGVLMMREHFIQRDELIISVESPSGEETQRAIASLAEHFKSKPTLVKNARWAGLFESGETASALLAWALQNAPPGKIAALRERMEAKNLTAHLQNVLETLASSPDPAVVQRLSYDPLGLTEALDMNAASSFDSSGFQLASADGRLRLMFLEPAEHMLGYKDAAKWLDAVRAEIKVWQHDKNFSSVQTQFTGEPAFLSEIGNDIEHDMRGTMGLTTGLIGLLFWIMFRRVKPLLWIVLLLALALGLTFAFAGLLIGKVSIMSMGFATIMLGLVVDYAVLIYQNASDYPQLTSRELRRMAAPSVLSGAGTTSAVFFALLLSSFPGMAQLGLLVAIGVIVGAALMLGFLPMLVAGAGRHIDAPHSTKPPSVLPAAIFTVLLVVVVAFVLITRGWSGFDGSSKALRPRHSHAMDAFEHLEKSVGQTDAASVPLIITAKDEDYESVARETERMLSQAKADGTIKNYAAAWPLAPHRDAQEKNRDTLTMLITEQPRLIQAVLDAGFTEDALLLFKGVTKIWSNLLSSNQWPTTIAQHPATEVLSRFISDRDPGTTIMLANIVFHGTPGTPDLTKLMELQARLRAAPEAHAQLAGWESLGPALAATVQRDFFWQTLPLMLILSLMLWLVFRNVKDFALLMVLLVFGAAMLIAAMTLIQHPWNLTSLAALPLHLGTGVDYGVYILLAMRRENHDITRVRGTTGRAVFFCGTATVIGFSSLIMANNQGIFSLGLACSIGLVNVLTLSLFLMPHWRRWLGK